MEIINTDVEIIEINPNISNFIISLRDIGYSFDTALADIIDNSISANAKIIKIFASAEDKKAAIIDDGTGMSQAELIEAMRLGSKNPHEERHSNDLGRFGLGLKTASFSQCKKLTVISKYNGHTFGYRWDLEYISKNNKWLLQEIKINQYENELWYEKLTGLSSGTIVVWEDIDRYEEEVFNIKLSDLNEHLALVFHRFLEGEFFNMMVVIELKLSHILLLYWHIFLIKTKNYLTFLLSGTIKKLQMG